MEWTIRWYVHMADKWKSRQDAVGDTFRGRRAYAEKQISMWNELGRVSEVMFLTVNSNHLPVWRLVA